MLPEEVDFVTDAILFLAEHGWKFLPLYRLVPHFHDSLIDIYNVFSVCLCVIGITISLENGHIQHG